MNVEIYYCGMWNYLPQASRLEEELKGNFPNVNVKKEVGRGGTFEVIVDGVLLFDKLSLPLDFGGGSSFPKENEITEKIKVLNGV